MFDNIGEKIQKLAVVTCVIGIIASVTGAIVLWCANSRYNPTVLAGFVVLILGSLFSWIGSFFTYGFGKLIEDTENIRFALSKQNNKASAEAHSEYWSNISKANQEPEGWHCTCGQINSYSLTYCTKCRRDKAEVVKKVTCKHCGANNNATNENCFACGKPMKEQ